MKTKLLLYFLLISSQALAAPKLDLKPLRLYRGIEQPVTVVVSNPDKKPLEGRLRWVLPSGWELAPKDAPVVVEGKGTLPCKHRVRPAANGFLRNGQVKVSLGKVSLDRTVTLEDAFSLQTLSLELPGTARAGIWKLELVNRSDQVLSGSLEVSLPKGWTIPGGSISRLKDIRPGETIYTTVRFEQREVLAPSSYTLRAVFRCQKAAVSATCALAIPSASPQ